MATMKWSKVSVCLFYFAVHVFHTCIELNVRLTASNSKTNFLSFVCQFEVLKRCTVFHWGLLVLVHHTSWVDWKGYWSNDQPHQVAMYCMNNHFEKYLQAICFAMTHTLYIIHMHKSFSMKYKLQFQNRVVTVFVLLFLTACAWVFLFWSNQWSFRLFCRQICVASTTVNTTLLLCSLRHNGRLQWIISLIPNWIVQCVCINVYN